MHSLIMSDLTIPTISNVSKPEAPGTGSRFRILKFLGGGGMGDVYLAQDLRLPRRVAIKTIRQDLCENTEIHKRIERECQLHAKIGIHPHIVALHDLLEEDGQISMVMEYVEGQTLQDLLKQNAHQGLSLSWQQSLDITRQILKALDRIHAHGIVHRDIKPSNILLSRDDAGRYCAKLMDFGIARPAVYEGTALTVQGGSGPGTPMYMAPEQIDTKTFSAVSPATDIYAMGVVLFQLLSGELPFSGSLTAVFLGHLTRKPPPLVISEDAQIPLTLADIVRRALEKNPAERFPSAKAFREALDQVSEYHLTQSGKTPGVPDCILEIDAIPPSPVLGSLSRRKAIVKADQKLSFAAPLRPWKLFAWLFMTLLLMSATAFFVSQPSALMVQLRSGWSRLGLFHPASVDNGSDDAPHLPEPVVTESASPISKALMKGPNFVLPDRKEPLLPPANVRRPEPKTVASEKSKPSLLIPEMNHQRIQSEDPSSGHIKPGQDVLPSLPLVDGKGSDPEMMERREEAKHSITTVETPPRQSQTVKFTQPKDLPLQDETQAIPEPTHTPQVKALDAAPELQKKSARQTSEQSTNSIPVVSRKLPAEKSQADKVSENTEGGWGNVKILREETYQKK